MTYYVTLLVPDTAYYVGQRVYEAIRHHLREFVNIRSGIDYRGNVFSYLYKPEVDHCHVRDDHGAGAHEREHERHQQRFVSQEQRELFTRDSRVDLLENHPVRVHSRHFERLVQHDRDNNHRHQVHREQVIDDGFLEFPFCGPYDLHFIPLDVPGVSHDDGKNASRVRQQRGRDFVPGFRGSYGEDAESAHEVEDGL